MMTQSMVLLLDRSGWTDELALGLESRSAALKLTRAWLSGHDDQYRLMRRSELVRCAATVCRMPYSCAEVCKGETLTFKVANV